MLREIMVPLVKVVQLKGKSAQKTRLKDVGISILGSNLKITTNRHKFKFTQTEPVSDRVKPLTVSKACVRMLERQGQFNPGKPLIAWVI